jgi:hypothetical protein
MFRNKTMSLPNEFPNDRIEELLQLKQKSSADANLRQAVLSGTLGIIRRRRRVKRCMVAATLLGCYLAGVATVVLWRPGIMNLSTRTTTPVVAETKLLPKTIVPVALTPEEELAAIKAYKPTSAPKSRFEVLRRTGDRYLKDPDKLQLAVQTYSKALKYATAEERAISPEHDTWLLMALKDAHSKETKNDAQL